ncbi:MAG TPA: CsbD family protein [Longimicrobiaceae bacterium]|nr:CsbD family protein [Longimicrobiaceae bacterium]
MADRNTGRAEHLGGKIKEGVGDLLGDREMEREGRLDQMEGQAEQDRARAEEAEDEARARQMAARNARNRRL